MTYLDFKNLDEINSELKNWLIKITESDKSITGICSGFDKLDRITKGFQPSNLVLIGGSTGMGKTSFAITLVRKIAIENHFPTAFFSLKMTTHQLMMRIIAQQIGIEAEKLRLGLFNGSELEHLTKSIAKLENTPLYINDFPSITVSDIENTLLCSPPDFAKIIIIDSLELIAKNKKERVGKLLNKRELTKITFQLKKIAEKFNITIVVLCHFSLPKEKLKNNYSKRPQLSDLRKYAPIDTYADLVLFLYRPEYYKIDEWEDNEPSSTAGEVEIIVAKNNNCILDSFRLKYEWKKGFFEM